MARLDTRELGEIADESYERCEAILARCSQEEWKYGLAWYQSAARAAEVIAEQTDSDRSTAAAVIAALSPRVRWSYNVADAIAIADGATSGFMAIGRNVVKAWRIIAGESPSDVLGGRKVRSFWRNIAHPYTSADVTIDVWTLRALVDDTRTDHYVERYAFLARRGVYDAISDGVRRSADERGIMPHQVQATVWVHARGGHG